MTCETDPRADPFLAAWHSCTGCGSWSTAFKCLRTFRSGSGMYSTWEGHHAVSKSKVDKAAAGAVAAVALAQAAAVAVAVEVVVVVVVVVAAVVVAAAHQRTVVCIFSA